MSNDLVERLRARADRYMRLMGNWYIYSGADAELDREAAEALARPVAEGWLPSKAEIERALAETWHQWGGWHATESGLVNMTGVLADSMLDLFAAPAPAAGERQLRILTPAERDGMEEALYASAAPSAPAEGER
ncbi:hypothetical protein [Consotaella salsifontis]|uniref:Uncharacterized protein n=1 Tax=Consotaella salsifontis TaxID=1365950 RepID=A0A1T4RW42_9HYPH|nr:hypothetical protein [Consotaella salsifontis]SKA20229.1 hypothetical protein SAMN05428963_10825 [Consotaella salsifontis]